MFPTIPVPDFFRGHIDESDTTGIKFRMTLGQQTLKTSDFDPEAGMIIEIKRKYDVCTESGSWFRAKLLSTR